MSDGTENGAAAHRRLRVWDVPVRVFHWVLVSLIAVSWITVKIGGNAMTYHMWSGYAILALVLFRVVWGFVGSHHARFSDFVYGPRATIAYLRGLLRLDPPFYAGHNPMGGWSVILLLTCVLVQASTGLFANDEIMTEGPLVKHVGTDLSNLITTVHRLNFNILLALVCIHVAAALFYLLVKRENLIGAMFTGVKKIPAQSGYTEQRMTSLWVAVVVLAIAAVVVRVVVTWGGSG